MEVCLPLRFCFANVSAFVISQQADETMHTEHYIIPAKYLAGIVFHVGNTQFS